MDDTQRYLLGGAKAASTLVNYERCWSNYLNFLLDFDLPHSESALCTYIGCLFDNDYKGSTITSYISALAYACGINGLEDYSKSVLVKELLKGARNRSSTPDRRKPILEPMLQSLMRAVHWVIPTHKKQTLFKCVFSWAFYGALRVSEYTQGTLADHNLQVENIRRTYEVDDIVYKLKFSSYKFHQAGSPAEYTMGPAYYHECCPVQLMNRYLAFRGHEPGPLFLLYGKPLRGNIVSSVLQSCIRFIGLDPSDYSPHSFRIGRCTQWSMEGLNQDAIRLKGRWNSDAYMRYIRMDSVILL